MSQTLKRKIYAIKGDVEWAQALGVSLREGVGRFGWSSIDNGDLRRLQSRIDEAGWDDLNEHERDCFQGFLLDLNVGDWVIYINIPTKGYCTMARVTGPYYWEKLDRDFNHRFLVDPETVHEFDRNDSTVHPALSARLKLRGRYWRVNADAEFELLLSGQASQKPFLRRTPQDSATLLQAEIEPLLKQITARIQHTHPNYDLEKLLELIFRAMPRVLRVNRQGGAGDNGADLIVEYEGGLPIPALLTQHTCIVQAKSFTGEHWDTRAVEDIRRAFSKYPTAEVGLIVSTADASTPILDAAVEKLREETGKPVHLLIGADVARFILRFGAMSL